MCVSMQILACKQEEARAADLAARCAAEQLYAEARALVELEPVKAFMMAKRQAITL